MERLLEVEKNLKDGELKRQCTGRDWELPRPILWPPRSWFKSVGSVETAGNRYFHVNLAALIQNNIRHRKAQVQHSCATQDAGEIAYHTTCGDPPRNIHAVSNKKLGCLSQDSGKFHQIMTAFQFGTINVLTFLQTYEAVWMQKEI